MTIAQSIAEIAKTYLGKEEIQPNAGFKDPVMDHEMRTMTPWYTGAPWCACLAILVWKKAYAARPDMLSILKPLFSASSQQMGRNFHADPHWPTSTDKPRIGAMAIFGDVGSETAGHTACAVISIDPDGIHYTTVEGNTRPPGNPGNVAEGYCVASHVHAVGAPHPVTGLQFMRFIYAIESYNPLVY
jgi:hypothetical protein